MLFVCVAARSAGAAQNHRVASAGWWWAAILFGEGSLRRALTQILEYYHTERNHQGKGNVLLLPSKPSRRQRLDRRSDADNVSWLRFHACGPIHYNGDR
jgi:hypothetical protein